MPRTDSLEKTLMLAKIKVGRKGRQRLRSLDGITDASNMSLSRELVMNRGCSPWGRKESDTTEWLTLNTNLGLRGILVSQALKQEFSSVQLLSRVWLFVTPWTAALQASLSISWSLLKLMSELVTPSNHLILCCPLFLLPSTFPSIRVFSIQSIIIGNKALEQSPLEQSPEIYYCVCPAKSLQSHPTPCDLMNSSPPGSSVSGILQTTILE